MKREIKFRVWDHNTNTMMIPDNFEFYNGKIGWIDASVTREEIADKWGRSSHHAAGGATRP